jgi:DNA-binding transcriptional regulator YiaG
MTDTHPLKAFRDREQLSQHDLARLIGVSRPSVTRWENGTRKPDGRQLSLIQKKTGIAPADLRPDLAAVFE